LWLLFSLYTVRWKTPVLFRTLDRNGITMLSVEHLGQESQQISWTGSDYEINMQVSFGNRNHSKIKIFRTDYRHFLDWKCHIGELTSRLNKACYAIRSIKPFMSLGVLRSTCFLYVHSIISYEIIFWGNSSHSEEIFKIQKRINWIITNSSKNASCRQLFKELNILPIQSQYIYSLFLFVIKNKDQFLFKS
jgi:hypothetical protein